MTMQELSDEVLAYFASINGGGDKLQQLIVLCDCIPGSTISREWYQALRTYFTNDMSSLDYEYDLEDKIVAGEARDEGGGDFDISKPYFYYDADLNIISTSNPEAFDAEGLSDADVISDIYELWNQIDDENEAEYYDFLDALPRFVKDLFVEYTYFNGDTEP